MVREYLAEKKDMMLFLASDARNVYFFDHWISNSQSVREGSGFARMRCNLRSV